MQSIQSGGLTMSDLSPSLMNVRFTSREQDMATKAYTDTVDIIVEMAGYGIRHWASSAVIDTEARTYRVTEDANGTVHVLTDTKIHKALCEAAKEHAAAKETLREYRAREEFIGGELGSDDADIIIQLAAFGELVYG